MRVTQGFPLLAQLSAVVSYPQPRINKRKCDAGVDSTEIQVVYGLLKAGHGEEVRVAVECVPTLLGASTGCTDVV
jgi:hypothetical protein